MESLACAFKYVLNALNVRKLIYISVILKNIYVIEYGINSINDLLTGTSKRFRIYQVLWLDIAEGAFRFVLCHFLKSLK